MQFVWVYGVVVLSCSYPLLVCYLDWVGLGCVSVGVVLGWVGVYLLDVLRCVGITEC